MKNGSFTTTLMPRNSGLVPVILPKSSLKKNRFGPKVMFCVWWNYEGVNHLYFVPNKRAVDVAPYSQRLERDHEILRRSYPALVIRIKVPLQKDNARPHTAGTGMTQIQELGRIELLPHPAYSPDLAPSDYHLFRSMARFYVEVISKTLKLWKWVSMNSSHEKPEIGTLAG